MKTIGVNLSSITTSENFAWAAIQITDYFPDDFGDQFETPATLNVNIQKAIKQCGVACMPTHARNHATGGHAGALRSRAVAAKHPQMEQPIHGNVPP